MESIQYANTISTWNQLAEQYQEKFMDLDLYDDTYRFLCDKLPKKQISILEIGCGPGNISKKLIARFPEAAIDATDVASNMIELAKMNLPQLNCFVLDCREISSLIKKYDAVVCGFCLPYLAMDDVIKLIADTSGLLNSGGLFYLSLIDGNYDDSRMEKSSKGEESMFVYYYNSNQLQQWLKESNFRIEKEIRKEYLKGDGNHSTHLIFIAERN